MIAPSSIVSALVVLSALSAANAAPVGSNLNKRCLIGKCDTVSNTNMNSSSYNGFGNWQTTNNENHVDNSGNQSTTGNSAGGNAFGAIKMGKVCRRAYVEARKRAIDEHVAKVERRWDAHHHPHRSVKNISNTSTRISNTRTTNIGSGNLRQSTTKIQSNNGNYGGNSGLMVGAGAACARSLNEVEVEKRELDAGASVLAALGGLSKRSLDDHADLLATRELGRMADVLSVRALGHDAEQATHYKRSVGLECSSTGEECNEFAKREAEEILRMHTRQLGFDFEEA